VRRNPVAYAAFALAIAAYGCAHHDDPLALASDTTRGVYDADLTKTTEHFDAALRLQATPGSVKTLSAQMHALGAYRGLTPTASDPAKQRYDFEAAFDKGAMLVELRLDPNGRIGAYRVVPEIAVAR
jgi:TPR repeat protein